MLVLYVLPIYVAINSTNKSSWRQKFTKCSSLYSR